MASKSKGLEEKQALQAVLICDSFNYRFLPITESKPRVLLPLLNSPILEYSLNALKNSGVEDVFLYCNSHSRQIYDYVTNVWSARTENKTVRVQVFYSDGFMSVGDLFRDLDAKGLIRHEFIFMYGDVVSNLPLKACLEEHRNVVKQDKSCIMSLLTRECPPGHRARSMEDEVVLVVDNHTNKLLLYEKTVNSRKRFNVNVSLFQENRSVRIHFNLQDTHVAICSLGVPSLFADNFDYETKDDFVRGILEQEEILGNTIRVKVCDSNAYAARVLNPTSYDMISRDILQRWSYPIVPDMWNTRSYQRHNIYKEKSVTLNMGSIVERNVAIGENTKIGSNAFIVNSVIGANCKIGNNVKIEGAYIWNNVIIGDNCKFSGCILADNVQVKHGTQIQSGCLISFGVILGPDVTLKHCTYVSLPSEDEEIDEASKRLLGTECRGCVYEEGQIQENDCSVDVWGQEDSDIDEKSWTRSSASETHTEDDVEEEIDDYKTFYGEIVDSFHRGIEERIAPENLILEINSSKHAYNIPIKELNMLVIKAILDAPRLQPSSVSYYTQLMPLLRHCKPVIRNYAKSNEAQVDLLMSVEEFALLYPTEFTPEIFQRVTKFLYDDEILEEEAIMSWFSDPKPLPSLLSDSDFNLGDQESLRRRQPIAAFIKWLQEAEEESSEED